MSFRLVSVIKYGSWYNGKGFNSLNKFEVTTKMRSNKRVRAIQTDMIVPPPPSSSRCYTDSDISVVSRRAFRQHIIVPVFQDHYPIAPVKRKLAAWELVSISFSVAFIVFSIIATAII